MNQLVHIGMKHRYIPAGNGAFRASSSSVKNALQKCGVCQSDLAKKLFCTRSTIGNVIHGRDRSARIEAELSAALGMPFFIDAIHEKTRAALAQFRFPPEAKAAVPAAPCFAGYPIRTLVLDGKRFWAVKDICLAVGYKDYSHRLTRIPASARRFAELQTASALQQMVVTNKQGISEMLAGSRKPKVKQFLYWLSGGMQAAHDIDAGANS